MVNIQNSLKKISLNYPTLFHVIATQLFFFQTAVLCRVFSSLNLIREVFFRAAQVLITSSTELHGLREIAVNYVTITSRIGKSRTSLCKGKIVFNFGTPAKYEHGAQMRRQQEYKFGIETSFHTMSKIQKKQYSWVTNSNEMILYSRRTIYRMIFI